MEIIGIYYLEKWFKAVKLYPNLLKNPMFDINSFSILLKFLINKKLKFCH